MKITFSLFVFLLLAISCSSQYGMIRVQAFVRQSVAGTIRVDDNGRPLNSGITITHLVYIETNASMVSPHWETAWVDGKSFTIQAVAVQPGQVIGKTKNGQDVRVSAKTGNKLWQLVLSPSSATVENKLLKKQIASTKILLIGQWKNKQVTYKVKNEQEMQTIYNQ